MVIGSDESHGETFQTGTPPFQPAIDFFQQCMRGEETPAYMADHADGTLRVVVAAFESAHQWKTGGAVGNIGVERRNAY